MAKKRSKKNNQRPRPKRRKTSQRKPLPRRRSRTLVKKPKNTNAPTRRSRKVETIHCNYCKSIVRFDRIYEHYLESHPSLVGYVEPPIPLFGPARAIALADESPLCRKCQAARRQRGKTVCRACEAATQRPVLIKDPKPPLNRCDCGAIAALGQDQCYLCGSRR